MNDELDETVITPEAIAYANRLIRRLISESTDLDMTCPACGATEAHVVMRPKWQYWVCENCEMSSRVDTGDALADLAWWQEAAKLKREKEGLNERA